MTLLQAIFLIYASGAGITLLIFLWLEDDPKASIEFDEFPVPWYQRKLVLAFLSLFWPYLLLKITFIERNDKTLFDRRNRHKEEE